MSNKNTRKSGKIIKLSDDVEIEIIYRSDGKDIATITIFKDGGSVSSTHLGWLIRKDNKNG